MATRTCPDCATQYLATVRRCIDCDTLLVDDPTEAHVGDELRQAPNTDDGHGTIRIALTGWGNQLKVTLDGMLERAEIPHVWEAGDLVVSERFRDEVAELLENLEGRAVAEGEADRPADDADHVALEIEGLEPDDRDRLDALLLESGIGHAWGDDGALIVIAEDEETVIGLVDRAFAADPADDPADDGETLQLLSELFVATDRLIRRIGDNRAEADFHEAIEAVRDRPAPYGFDGRDWTGLRAAADALRPAGPDDADHTEDEDGDAERRQGLTALREQLRQLV